MKDFASNKKYFTQRSPVPFHVAYVVVCFAALAIFFLGARLWPISFAIFFIGSFVEVAVCQRYVSDKYFETFLSEEKERFASEFEEQYQPVDPRTYHRNAALSAALSEKHAKPIYGGEYRFLPSDFERVGVPMQIRVGLDTVVRSSVYCITGMQIDPRRVCLMTRRICMTEDLEVTDCATFPYEALSSVTMEVTDLPIENRAAHCIELVFYSKEGTAVFRLPVHGGYDAEEQIERLNDLIQKSAEADR